MNTFYSKIWWENIFDFSTKCLDLNSYKFLRKSAAFYNINTDKQLQIKLFPHENNSLWLCYQIRISTISLKIKNIPKVRRTLLKSAFASKIALQVKFKSSLSNSNILFNRSKKTVQLSTKFDILKLGQANRFNIFP